MIWGYVYKRVNLYKMKKKNFNFFWLIYMVVYFILFFVKFELFGKKYKYFNLCVDVKNFILYCGCKVVKFKFFM